jgi:hypothetical protein
MQRDEWQRLTEEIANAAPIGTRAPWLRLMACIINEFEHLTQEIGPMKQQLSTAREIATTAAWQAAGDHAVGLELQLASVEARLEQVREEILAAIAALGQEEDQTDAD